MRDITDIATTAMRESRAWPAVLETGSAQELWRTAHEALTTAGFAVVQKEATAEVIASAAIDAITGAGFEIVKRDRAHDMAEEISALRDELHQARLQRDKAMRDLEDARADVSRVRDEANRRKYEYPLTGWKR